MSRISIGAARVSVGAAGLFVVLLVALHMLRSDLDPSWRFISEYEIGEYGGLMRLAFVALATSCAGLFVALLPDMRLIRGWFGMILLFVSSVGMVLAAIYAPSKENKLHELGAMLDNVPFAALLINWSLLRHPTWSGSRKMLIATAWLPLLGLVVFMGSLAVMLPANGGQPGPSVLAGWPNRFFVLAHLAWLVPVAWRCSSRFSPQSRAARVADSVL